MLIDAAFLKIDPRALDHILDDLLVDVADLSVRHLGGMTVWRGKNGEDVER